MRKFHQLVLLLSVFGCTTKTAYSTVTIYNEHQKDVSDIPYLENRDVILFCNSTNSGDSVEWLKNGKKLETTEALTKRYTVEGNKLTLIKLKATDAGNYTCQVVDDSEVKYNDTVLLTESSNAIWGVRVNKNMNVVEGEKLTIRCEVRGDLQLTWYYVNTTSNGNRTELTANEERFKLLTYYDEETKVNITNGELKIEEVKMWDRGEYTCVGESKDAQSFNSTSTVRVKDKYAALWPFLGICAEVFVLCAIIFVYEKKRNKSEMEESDTDQSPDQKNTPDHGKESNLRHRQ